MAEGMGERRGADFHWYQFLWVTLFSPLAPKEWTEERRAAYREWQLRQADACRLGAGFHAHRAVLYLGCALFVVGAVAGGLVRDAPGWYDVAGWLVVPGSVGLILWSLRHMKPGGEDGEE